MKVSSFMLRKLYVPKSLGHEGSGFSFRLKNNLSTANLVAIPDIVINGEPMDPKQVRTQTASTRLTADDYRPDQPILFKMGSEVTILVDGRRLPPGPHRLQVRAQTKEWDVLEFEIEDSVE